MPGITLSTYAITVRKFFLNLPPISVHSPLNLLVDTLSSPIGHLCDRCGRERRTAGSRMSFLRVVQGDSLFENTAPLKGIGINKGQERRSRTRMAI